MKHPAEQVPSKIIANVASNWAAFVPVKIQFLEAADLRLM